MDVISELMGVPEGDRAEILCGHLVDRSGMAHSLAAFGREGMTAVAIEEWQVASPVYTRRMQEALGFTGDGVETIFKGLQLDIGAPPQFMDFGFRIDDHNHGEFWLDHCGALADVEPMGDDYVMSMCHDIEDPTFDATALATNPHAQVRPIHRPPRRPADRKPRFCARVAATDEHSWSADIVLGDRPFREAGEVALTRFSTGAAFTFTDREYRCRSRSCDSPPRDGMTSAVPGRASAVADGAGLSQLHDHLGVVVAVARRRCRRRLVELATWSP